MTVALSGDGGDESFGGYDFRYVPHALEGARRDVAAGRARGSALRDGWRRGGRARRGCRAPLRLGTLLENLARDAGGRVLRRPLLPEAAGDARAAGPAADRRSGATARSTRRSPSRIGGARRRAPCSARSTPT